MLYRKSIELVATGVVNVTYSPAALQGHRLAAHGLIGQLALGVARADDRPVGGGVLRQYFGVRQVRAAAACGSCGGCGGCSGCCGGSGCAAARAACGGCGGCGLDRHSEDAASQQRGAARCGEDSS